MTKVKFNVSNYLTSMEGPKDTISVACEALSYTIDGIEHINRAKGISWSGKTSFFERKGNVFMTGFLPRVLVAMEKAGVDYEINNVRKKVSPLNDPLDFTLADPENGEIAMREYQQRNITEGLGYARGIVKIATGGGKTETAISLAKNVGCETLFVVHTKTLLHQTYERFCKRLPEMADQIGMIGDGIFDPQKITIALVNTVSDNLNPKSAKAKTKKGKAIKKLCENCKLLFVDEAHLATSKRFQRLINACSNAYFRFALTATPYMREKEEDNLIVEGLFGPILSEVTALELIEAGYLAQPYFKFIDISEPKRMKTSKDWEFIYDRGIVNNEYRNNRILEEAQKIIADKGKVLITVSRREHGENLTKIFSLAGVRHVSLNGSSSGEQRNEGIESLKKGDIDCIIATTIFDEGVDVPDLNAVILAGANKSAPAVYQRSGRGMRKKDGDNKCIIIDFMDRQNNTLLKQSKARLKVVKNEPGFELLGIE